MAVMLLSASQIFSIPVFNKLVKLVQPDGTTIAAVLDGDEFASCLKDTDGHRLIQDKNGFYCYAAFTPEGTIYSSGYIAGREAPSDVLSGSLNPGTSSAQPEKRRLANRKTMERAGAPARIKTAAAPSAAPVKKHSIVLLVEFQDKKMTYGREDFVRMLTQKGYSVNGAQGSAKDYFDEQFRGDFTFSFDVSGIITLDHDCSYYFGNDGENKDKNASEAVYEACVKAAAAGTDFSAGDDDGDGEVDNVFIFTAGKDEADGGGEDCVWSHMYYLEYTPFKGLVLGGKTINNYAISTELGLKKDGSSGFASIGTFCHEYSHALGLMDLYDTDGDGSGGMGNGLWYVTGLMDGGSNNNAGNTPPHYNAIDYDLSGIGNPETLREGSYTLEPISENRRYLKMETGVKGEYYLIECRDGKGWDRYIGGKGMLIYHIDRSNQAAGRSDWAQVTVTAAQRWLSNEVNCRPDRQCAELVSATAGISAFSNGYYMKNASEVFFPSAEGTSFTPQSSPAFVLWNGNGSPLSITDIRTEGDAVCFNVVKSEEISVPSVTIGNTEVLQDAAIIQWTADDAGYDGPAYVEFGKSGKDTTTRKVEPYGNGRYAAVLDSLSQMTAYRATIYFMEAGVKSREETVSFTTKRMYDGGYPFIYLNNSGRNADGSFPEGAMIPLRIYNLRNYKNIEWYMGGRKISVGGNGYYRISAGGKLKAVISLDDGSEEVIVKEIFVK